MNKRINCCSAEKGVSQLREPRQEHPIWNCNHSEITIPSTCIKTSTNKTGIEIALLINIVCINEIFELRIEKLTSHVGRVRDNYTVLFRQYLRLFDKRYNCP